MKINGLPIIPAIKNDPQSILDMNMELTTQWLIAFLRDELIRRRGFTKAVIGLSGGVDSALSTALCSMALGADNVYTVRMPYKTSSQDSLDHAEACAKHFGVHMDTVEITDAVDGYLAAVPEADGRRRGNVMARMRMVVLFDQSEKYHALPIGTGNKTERLFGYFTWHADDAPAVNPLGDLFKTQVWRLSRHLGVPEEIVSKPPSADLVVGQTDEADLGISYQLADMILAHILAGYDRSRIISLGFTEHNVDLVWKRLNNTHWKRHTPTQAMLSATSINDYYLRPVDF